MRFVVELAPVADGRVEGSLARAGVEEIVRFSGWLELLRLLEVHSLPSPRPATGAEGDVGLANQEALSTESDRREAGR